MTALPNMMKLACATLLSLQVNAQIVWNAPTITADSGDVVGVNFTADGYQEIISAQGTIQFDETVLEFSHVDNFALTSMSSMSFGTTQVDQGLLSFSWYEASLIGQTIANGDTLFTALFNVIGSPGDSSGISLIDQPVITEFIDTSFSSVNHSSLSGTVFVHDPTADLVEIDLRQFTIYPNPATNWIRLQADSFNGELEMTWYALDGSIRKHASFQLMNELAIPLDDLESGIYYLQVVNKSTGFEKRLIQIL